MVTPASAPASWEEINMGLFEENPLLLVPVVLVIVVAYDFGKWVVRRALARAVPSPKR